MPKTFKPNDILVHFDKIADCYDNYKENNSYYYTRLKKLYKELISHSYSQSIIELGCGSGEIINFLNPKIGIGVDVSPKMINIALGKYHHKKNLRFFAGSIDDLEFMRSMFTDSKFDCCIIPDTIEHLSDIHKAFYVLSSVADKKTEIIITWVNPVWSPLLELLEVLKLKMPEGPHRWPKMQEVVSALQLNNFRILSKSYSTLMPFNIPILSDLVNAFIPRVPLLNKLCLIQCIVCQAS